MANCELRLIRLRYIHGMVCLYLYIYIYIILFQKHIYKPWSYIHHFNYRDTISIITQIMVVVRLEHITHTHTHILTVLKSYLGTFIIYAKSNRADFRKL